MGILQRSYLPSKKGPIFKKKIFYKALGCCPAEGGRAAGPEAVACPQACRPRCRRFPCPSRRPRPPPGGSRSSSSSRRGPGGNWRTSGTTSKLWSRWAGPGGTFHQQALVERLLYTSPEVRGRSRRMRAALHLSARCEASLPGPRVQSEEEPILLFSPLKNRPGPTPSQARCRPWGPREHSSRGRGVPGAPRAGGTVFC